MPRLSILTLVAVLAAAAVPGATVNVSLVDAKGAPVADAVVSLTVAGAATPPAAGPAVEIVQKNQTFIPYVTAISVGTAVVFPNEDNVQHHIYSLSKAKRFEKPLYAPGSRESVIFDQPGVVTIGCNIHDWMVAYIVVLPTPYFAKTGADGRVALAGLPPGSFRLEVWHPLLPAPQDRTLTLAADATESFVLALKPDRRIRRAPESKAGGY